MCGISILVIPALIVSEIFDMKTCLFLNGFSKFPSSGPHSSLMGGPKNFLFCMWTKHWKGYSFMMSGLPQCHQILLAASLNKSFGTEEKEVWLWKTAFCFHSILGGYGRGLNVSVIGQKILNVIVIRPKIFNVIVIRPKILNVTLKERSGSNLTRAIL